MAVEKRQNTADKSEDTPKTTVEGTTEQTVRDNLAMHMVDNVTKAEALAMMSGAYALIKEMPCDTVHVELKVKGYRHGE